MVGVSLNEVDSARTGELLERSLMLVTALAPHIGYDRAARIAKHAHENGLSLREAALGSGGVAAADFDAWVDALLFIQVLRLRHHDEASAQGASDDALDNKIDPERLNELDRRILKEAFRQARKLQARLALEYHL